MVEKGHSAQSYSAMFSRNCMLGLAWLIASGHAAAQTSPTLPPLTRLLAGGDMLLSPTTQPIGLPMQKGLAYLRELASRVHIAAANLEGPLDNGELPVKECLSEHCHSFGQPLSTAQWLAWAGFNAMSVNNNHSMDRGPKGRLLTRQSLAEQKVAPIWEEATYFPERRLVMLAYSTNRGAYDARNMGAVLNAIVALAPDWRVWVQVHAGAEGASAVKIPCARETYLGEDRGDVVMMGRQMVDAGASVVTMHGPHVPRAMELYKKRLIAYSLGNGLTAPGIGIHGPAGLSPWLDLRIRDDGSYHSHFVHWFRQDRKHGLVPISDPGKMPLLNDACAAVQPSQDAASPT